MIHKYIFQKCHESKGKDSTLLEIEKPLLAANNLLFFTFPLQPLGTKLLLALEALPHRLPLFLSLPHRFLPVRVRWLPSAVPPPLRRK